MKLKHLFNHIITILNEEASNHKREQPITQDSKQVNLGERRQGTPGNQKAPQPHLLAAEKAVYQMRFIDRNLGLSLFQDPEDWKSVTIDIATFIRYNDLKAVKVQALGHGDRVVFEYKIDFKDRRASLPGANSAQGIELPVLDLKQIKSGRMLVDRKGNEEAYRRLLKMSWATAPKHERALGATFKSEHTAKISGGRQEAEIFVTKGARHKLTVVRTGRDYCFAESPSIEGSVFVHRKYVNGLSLNEGDHIAATLIHTRRGIQARDITPA